MKYLLRLSLVMAAASGSAAVPDFGTRIQPLFEQHCAGCHGADKQKGGYRLDSRAAALAGGDSGDAALVPGDPTKSPLLRYVSGEDKDMVMPPKKSQVPGLTPAQVADLRAWVAAGAPWPEGIKLTAKMAAPEDKPADAHWSHQPVVRPPLPAAGGQPIDAFIEAKLAAEGLTPNPKADPRTLIRRLYFDLIGLPPTPEEVAAFEQSPAQAPLVERLLASPRYGERWARHWLDVVRFAESNGFEMNRARPNAWPYRDYVIRAFNDDMPYDRFVREQLAGDQLGADAGTGFLVAGSWDQVKGQDPVLRANQRADELHDMVSTVGSVFLGTTLGCARCHDHKFDPVPQADYFRIRAVLEGVQHGERPMKPADHEQRLAKAKSLEREIEGLDVRLAKFQPRAQAGRRLLLDDAAPPPAKDRESGCISLEQPSNGQAVEYSPGRDKGQLNDPGDAVRLPNLGESYRYWKHAPDGKPRDLFAWQPSLTGRFRIWISWGAWTTHAKDAEYLLDADGDLKTTADQSLLARVNQSLFADGSSAIAGEKRWSGFRNGGVQRLRAESLVVLREGADKGPTVADALLFEQVDEAAPTEKGNGIPHLRAPVSHLANTEAFDPVEARYVRFNITRSLTSQPCLDEFEIYAAGAGAENVALAKNGAKATAKDVFHDGALAIHQIAHLNDGRYGNSYSWVANAPTSWAQIELAKPQLIHRVVWSRDRAPPVDARKTYQDRLPTEYTVDVSLDGKTWTTVASSADRLAVSYREKVRDIPTLSGVPQDQRGEVAKLSAMRATLQKQLQEATHYPPAYTGKFEQPPPTHRLYRGDPMEPREEISPGTLSKIGRKLDFPAETPEAERRLGLADWIANANNPLTARVIVNRLWQYHFGRGLVDTPSDFGVNGGKPTHPELLEWLAAELMENGWSLKHIQRLIVSSATFQRSSALRPEAAKLDADSRLLWRFPSRRLEAEPLRDTMLAITGKLDLSAGGPGFDLFEPNDNYVKVYVSKAEFGPDTFRRMVYQNKPRMQLEDTFGAFDCPDAGQITPKRNRSTTALQALNLMNSPFLLQQSGFFAERLKKEAGADVNQQVERAFELAFTREASEAEKQGAVRLVEEHGLVMLCRAILNSSEFLYLP